MKKNILINGADGQLGSTFRKLENNYNSKYNFIFADIKEFNLLDNKQIENYFKNNSFEYIVHLAANTDVNGCETNPDSAKEISEPGCKYTYRNTSMQDT